MKQYLAMVKKEKSQFWHFSIQRFPCGDNEEADRLARLASSAIESLDPRIIVEHLAKPSIREEEDRKVNMADLEPQWAS